MEWNKISFFLSKDRIEMVKTGSINAQMQGKFKKESPERMCVFGSKKLEGMVEL